MDLPVAPSCSPFSYLVSEHARAVVAIQELQREVNSLLAFRDHVLEALPHLQLRGAQEAAPRPRPPSAPPSGKSLSEGGPSTVVDSGFSTDKASTSMGKSSSSSGELSGGARWTCVDPDGSGGGAGPPLGSAEDELWQLLEVIQRKGTKLRRELERAEQSEREYGHASDPTHTGVRSSAVPPPSSRVPQQENFAHLPVEDMSPPHGGSVRWKGPTDWWPHSLPGAGLRFDFVPGLETWGEMERLRQDRLYLMGKLSRAEAEASSSNQRLMELHSQLMSLAGEKRRLEDAFRTLKIDPLPGGDANSSSISSGNKISVGVQKGLRNCGTSGVTVSVRGEDSVNGYPKRGSSVRIGEEVFLPRVLKVPIREKSDGGTPRQKPSRTPMGISSQGSPIKSPSNGISGGGVSTTILLPVQENQASSATVPSNPGDAGSDRVVIERERSANRVDGGLSMPASLLKGSRIKVQPNKQRISAILREKDVLALQRQLLTTVMETEVLRRQMEIASDEWSVKISEWEAERQKNQDMQNTLRKENLALRDQLEAQKKTVEKVDVGLWVVPTMQTVGVGTECSADEPAPTFSVHQGPNVKYDIVVYEETPSLKSPKTPSPATRKAPPAVEKPPRRSRPPSSGVQATSSPNYLAPRRENYSGSEPSFGRDSLGRVTKVPLKPHSARSPSVNVSTTPTSTPRSSPAPSISGQRGGSRICQEGQPNRSTVVTSSRYISRRDSMKVALGTHSAGGPASYSNGRGTSIGSSSSFNSKVGGGAALVSSKAGSNIGISNHKGISNSGSSAYTSSSSSTNSKGGPSGGPHKIIPQQLASANGDIKIKKSTISSNNGIAFPQSEPNIPSSQSEGGSPPADSLDYYDSITATPPEELYTEQSNNVRYLPSATRMWDSPSYPTGLPAYIPHRGVAYYPWFSWLNGMYIWPQQDKAPIRDSLETEEESNYEDIHTPKSRTLYIQKNSRRKLTGALRIKNNVDRPSVLPNAKGTRTEKCEESTVLLGHYKGREAADPRSTKGACNPHVEEILAKIAARATY